jgi:murein DD-endopeptidase MepM/ murein hydrolase activator NlpD
MASGVVIEVGNQGRKGYGRFIRLRHADGSQTVYGHLWKEFVKVGQSVSRETLSKGTVMALTDNTGRSTGSHLHCGYRPFHWNQQNGYAGYTNFLNLLVI